MIHSCTQMASGVHYKHMSLRTRGQSSQCGTPSWAAAHGPRPPGLPQTQLPEDWLSPDQYSPRSFLEQVERSKKSTGLNLDPLRAHSSTALSGPRSQEASLPGQSEANRSPHRCRPRASEPSSHSCKPRACRGPFLEPLFYGEERQGKKGKAASVQSRPTSLRSCLD